MKQFTSVRDVKQPTELLALAKRLKKQPFAYRQYGQNKTLGLLFFNPSLRTRLSTQKAALNLGMDVMVMNFNSDSWTIELTDGTVMNQGTQEHIKEAAAVISQYCDIIGVRTFAGLKDMEADYSETILKKFIRHASAPVISLESATLHPLQSLADWLTIDEYKSATRPKVVLTWAPHPRALPQAVANSFAEWMQVADVDLTITFPVGMDLSSDFTKGCKVTNNQEEALQNADFVYAKNWSSFLNYGQITSGYEDWMITPHKMALTNNGKFMHCLPVRRNVVVSDNVLDTPTSIVIEQANNRTFAAQAVLLKMLGYEG